MRTITLIFFIMLNLAFQGCNHQDKAPAKGDVNIIFLHHSVGLCIWEGKHNFTGRFLKKLKRSALREAIEDKNIKDGHHYLINEQTFPKDKPYGWNNFPYDYYNIWVKHAGDKPYMEEPTLEMLSKQYQVIIWKHCFPVSNVLQDISPSNIDSPLKRIDNYKLQYLALRDKMHQFPNIKFIVWTGAAQVKNETNEMEAKRALGFFNWVKNEWDLPDDNIYLWDFRGLETENGLYLSKENAKDENNSHPNEQFSEKAAKLLAQRIEDIIENNGSKTTLTGMAKN